MRITPRNWRDFQHYKDRNPPWIRLHKALLDNYEFHSLPVASRALAPMLWLLASDSMDGSIDANPSKLAFRLRMTASEVVEALNPLIQNEFFVADHDASELLSERSQSAVPETEAETEAIQRSASRPPAVASASVREKAKKEKPQPVPVSVLIEAGFSEAVAAEFIAHKAAQKAPLTPRAWADHLSEAKKAGWSPVQAAEKVMAKSWKGFEARYVANEQRPMQSNNSAPPVVSPSIEQTRELLASQELSPEQIEANKARASELRRNLGNLVRIA